MEQALTKTNGGSVQTVRQGFGEVESRQQFETAATAVAARHQAMVQARFIVADRRPRDVEDFRQRLLKECQRPGFAEMCEYSRPVGWKKDKASGKWIEEKAHGPTIHLIRTALAIYRNVEADSAVLFESPETRLTYAYVLDLETNVSWARTITVSKTVEKRGKEDRQGNVKPPEGREVIGERINTDGDTVYICIATDDEIRSKEANLVARAQRENGRSLLPRDILEEAVAEARETIARKIKEDPDAAKRKIFDGFAEFDIMPSELAAYIGHPVERLTPAEIAELRKIWASLKDGDTTWEEVMLSKDPTGSIEAAEKVASDKLANIRKQEQQQKQPDPPQQQAEKQPPTEEEMRNEDPEQQRQIQEERARKQQSRIAFGRTNK